MHLNKSNEDYLKQIYLLSDQTTDIKTSTLSACLNVSPAAVTDQVKKLAALGLVDYQPYKGVILTDLGQTVGRNMVRRHRVLELFLHDVLGLRWDEVHTEAERLEHAVSDMLISKMAETLGNPQFDPHGDPIPSVGGDMPAHQEGVLLSECPVGFNGTVVRVLSNDTDFLKCLDAHGVALSRVVELVSRQEFDGAVHVKVNTRLTTFSQHLADNIVLVPVDQTGVSRK
jgi:DtxR family Mn-dependent transcriptional regulator